MNGCAEAQPLVGEPKAMAEVGRGGGAVDEIRRLVGPVSIPSRAPQPMESGPRRRRITKLVTSEYGRTGKSWRPKIGWFQLRMLRILASLQSIQLLSTVVSSDLSSMVYTQVSHLRVWPTSTAPASASSCLHDTAHILTLESDNGLVAGLRQGLVRH